MLDVPNRQRQEPFSSDIVMKGKALSDCEMVSNDVQQEG